MKLRLSNRVSSAIILCIVPILGFRKELVTFPIKCRPSRLTTCISGMRANNNPFMKAAKKCFSPLFHVNQNPIYSQLDIHSDYIDEQMKSKASQIEKYLETRRCPNKTVGDYQCEPHDECHEEFNKRGLNFGVTNCADNFIKNFSVADSYFEMRDNLFEEYDTKKMLVSIECRAIVTVLRLLVPSKI